MKDEDRLRESTIQFFQNYWKESFGPPPSWSEHWNFDGTIPNHDTRGCYALFSQDEIVYVGSGIGKSVERYLGSGLGDRLKTYRQLNKNINPATRYTQRTNWEDITV